jgi:hypothetical protein
MSTSDISDRIGTLAAQASYMRAQPVSHGWNELWDAMEQLDQDVAPGLAIGRYLLLPSGDGREPYLIDQIESQRVHVIYLGIDDGPSAGAVDSDGWCLRSVAEQEIARRGG